MLRPLRAPHLSLHPVGPRIHSQHPWFLLRGPCSSEFPAGTCYRLNRYRLSLAEMKLKHFRSLLSILPTQGKKVIVNWQAPSTEAGEKSITRTNTECSNASQASRNRAFQIGTWSNWLLLVTRPMDSTTLQLTCTVDRHTIIWVHCAPASVCSIRTCKYVESAQNSKYREALGKTKQ